MCSRRGRGEEGRRGIGERDENGSLFEGGGGGGGGGWKAAGGLRGRGTKRREGVVPGSTNQRQDAIDRHVARGLVQRMIPTGRVEDGGLERESSCFWLVVVETEPSSLRRWGRRRSWRRGWRREAQTYSAHSVTLTGKPY